LTLLKGDRNRSEEDGPSLKTETEKDKDEVSDEEQGEGIHGAITPPALLSDTVASAFRNMIPGPPSFGIRTTPPSSSAL
jgi:hypothetical protein